MNNTPYSALAVANFFIKKSIQEQAPLTLLKLIKLCYIAQGTYIWKTKMCLFNERCEAWKYGPVIPEIYAEFKHYGTEEVKAQGGYSKGLDSEGNPIYLSINEDDIETKKILDFVWENFKKYTAFELSGWTHRKGSAWSEAYKNKSFLSNNPTITVEMLKKEFDQVLEEDKNEN